MTDYKQINEELYALIHGVPYVTANLANAAALIYYSLENINWAGFYTVEGDKLVLGPFQGKPACIVIPLGKGVCGNAVVNKKLFYVPDVHEFPGHIACDAASASEFVVPIKCPSGEVIALLDIDSPVKNRFDKNDIDGLTLLAATVESECFNK